MGHASSGHPSLSVARAAVEAVELVVAALMIDGIIFAEVCCVVALVITTDGTKVPVGLWDGDRCRGSAARRRRFAQTPTSTAHPAQHCGGDAARPASKQVRSRQTPSPKDWEPVQTTSRLPNGEPLGGVGGVLPLVSWFAGREDGLRPLHLARGRHRRRVLAG